MMPTKQVSRTLCIEMRIRHQKISSRSVSIPLRYTLCRGCNVIGAFASLCILSGCIESQPAYERDMIKYISKDVSGEDQASGIMK
jgi:hypothetical protein